MCSSLFHADNLISPSFVNKNQKERKLKKFKILQQRIEAIVFIDVFLGFATFTAITFFAVNKMGELNTWKKILAYTIISSHGLVSLSDAAFLFLSCFVMKKMLKKANSIRTAIFVVKTIVWTVTLVCIASPKLLEIEQTHYIIALGASYGTQAIRKCRPMKPFKNICITVFFIIHFALRNLKNQDDYIQAMENSS